MDFSWTAEQLALRDEALAFAVRELNDELAARDRGGDFARGAWERCAAFGVQGACVPEAYGGRGLDVPTAVLMMEAIGYGCRDNGLTLALNGQMWALQQPILAFGTEEQKRRYLPRLCSGQWIGADAMTEPGSGSDAFSLRTVAEKRGDGYVLSGRKTFIGLAPVADVALVFATLNPKLGRWGITAFLVEADTPGYHAGPPQEKLGLRTEPMGEILLEECYVPATQRLGPEGAGVSIFNSTMEWERSFIFASHVGAMASQLDRAVRYAQEREQFGRPIGAFQAVSHRIAEMRVRLEAARLMLYHCAWLKGQGRPAAMESAIAKLFISESFAESSVEAMRVFGGRGYLAGHDAERDLRDAAGGVIYAGTNDIQRNVIAALLGL